MQAGGRGEEDGALGLRREHRVEREDVHGCVFLLLFLVFVFVFRGGGGGGRGGGGGGGGGGGTGGGIVVIVLPALKHGFHHCIPLCLLLIHAAHAHPVLPPSLILLILLSFRLRILLPFPRALPPSLLPSLPPFFGAKGRTEFLTRVGYFGLAREEDKDATRRKLAVDLADLGRGGTE